MIFNNFKDLETYFRNTYKNLRFEVQCNILSVRDLDFNLISNYDLRFINFLMLDRDICNLNYRNYEICKEELNYKF